MEENLLEWGLSTSSNIAQGWDDVWQSVILDGDGGLYASVVFLAQLFCLGALLFFMMQFARQMIEDGEISGAYTNIILPIFGLLLISTGLFSDFMFLLRNIMHDISTMVLNSSLHGVTLEQAIRGTLGNRALNSSISAIAAQCTGLLGQEQVTCLEQASEQVQTLLGEYQSAYPDISINPAVEEIGRGAWATARTGAGVGSALSNPLLGLLGASGTLAAMTDTMQFIIEAILMGLQWAFANLLEGAMLLTAIVGPLAIAGLILPYDGKPFFAWVVGFLSLGMAEVCYNIIIGLCAEMMVQAEVYEFGTFGYLMFIAVLAPALALAIASGGGMAVFGVMSGGATRIISTVTGGMIAASALKK
ncbi:MAG: hypothetical protein AAFY26_00845 [Cyanobacteria bacterium J06638_22]